MELHQGNSYNISKKLVSVLMDAAKKKVTEK